MCFGKTFLRTLGFYIVFTIIALSYYQCFALRAQFMMKIIIFESSWNLKSFIIIRAWTGSFWFALYTSLQYLGKYNRIDEVLDLLKAQSYQIAADGVRQLVYHSNLSIQLFFLWGRKHSVRAHHFFTLQAYFQIISSITLLEAF